MTGTITSRRNRLVQLARQLRTRRHRDESGLFTIEGTRELTRALDAGVTLRNVLFSPERFSENGQQVLFERIETESTAEVQKVEKSLLDHVSYRKNGTGMLAIAQSWAPTLANLASAPSSLFLVASGIEKPGNVGAMLRSADAVGASGVIVCDLVSDIFNPNIIRSSLGTVFTMPIAQAQAEQARLWLTEHEIEIVGATPAAPRSYVDVDLTGSVAVVIGSEAHGLDLLWKTHADHLVCLPQLGQSDSLNAATTAAVLLFEALRQRSR